MSSEELRLRRRTVALVFDKLNSVKLKSVEIGVDAEGKDAYPEGFVTDIGKDEACPIKAVGRTAARHTFPEDFPEEELEDAGNPEPYCFGAFCDEKRAGDAAAPGDFVLFCKHADGDEDAQGEGARRENVNGR